MEVRNIGLNQAQRQNFTALQPLQAKTAEFVYDGLKKRSASFAKKFADTFEQVSANQKENKFFDIKIDHVLKYRNDVPVGLKSFSILSHNKVAILNEDSGLLTPLATEIKTVKGLRKALKNVDMYVTKQAEIAEQVKRIPVEAAQAEKKAYSGGGHMRA